MPSLKRWVASRLSSVEVSESEGVRMLHLGGDAIQSAMRLSSPDALELHYTRAMMAFLLVVPEPRDVLLIGLGGGSIARFLRRHYRQTCLVAVEVNAKVISAARAWFGLPPDDDRLRVVLQDGAAYVAGHPDSCDVLLLDAFDDGLTVRALATRRYYSKCFDALRSEGILVQNFIADEPRLAVYLDRLEQVFEGNVLRLPAVNRVNVIALAMKGIPVPLSGRALVRRAVQLERRLGLPFKTMMRTLIEENRRRGLIQG